MKKAGKILMKTDFKYTLMTYNIGYCGLDDSQDFFMDGGRGSRSKSKEKTLENLTGIKSVISKYMKEQRDKENYVIIRWGFYSCDSW